MLRPFKTFLLLIALVIPVTTTAASGDLYIENSGLYLSSEQVLEGSAVRIYANVSNASNFDLKGIVRFYLDSDGVQISSDQVVSVLKLNSDIAFVDLYPPVGNHTIIAKVIPWDPSEDNAGNNIARRQVWVQADFDKDKIPNELDDDDDNDGVLDVEDAFPLDAKEQLDSDGDGIGNVADSDDDNDGVLDEADALPLDAMEQSDNDDDDDNDKLLDIDEELLGTNPLEADSDGDLVIDGEDDFPLDEKEQFDSDSDGIGNNTDTDDDGDGYLDLVDAFPRNHGPIVELSKKLVIFSNSVSNFSLRGSSDPDGEIVKYKWDIGGELYSGDKITHTFTNSGKQEIVVEVFDDLGEGRRVTYEVVVYSRLVLPFILLLIFGVVGGAFHWNRRKVINTEEV